VPDTDGDARLIGATGLIAAVAEDEAAVGPVAFVAVTTARMLEPMSAGVRV
jgi:hypothetical protein